MSDNPSSNANDRRQFRPAPYPPFQSASLHVPASSNPMVQQQQPLRPSLRASPHYSAGNLREQTSRDEWEDIGGVGAGDALALRRAASKEEDGWASSAAAAVTAEPASPSFAFPNRSAAPSKQRLPAPSRIEFCSRDLIAGINLADPPADSERNGSIGGGGRGPKLLELWRVTVADHESETTSEGTKKRQIFHTTPIANSCSNPSFGMSLASTCLQVQPESIAQTDSQRVRVATGISTGGLCVHSFDASLESSVEDPSRDTAPITIDMYHASPRYHRQATAVAWSPKQSHLVALGLVGPAGDEAGAIIPGMNHHSYSAGSIMDQSGRNSSMAFALQAQQLQPFQTSGLRSTSQGPGLLRQGVTATGAGIGAGGDHEYCCFLWDVEHQQQQPSVSSSQGSDTATGRTGGRAAKASVPLFKLSYQMGVASLGWVLEQGQTLAVGGQSRNLQLYDLRMSPGIGGLQYQQAPVASVFAHNFGVHGIETDPFRPWQFATFCRAMNEPVKLWDARMMDTIVSEIKFIGQGNTSETTNNIASVVAAKWSKLESGRIDIAVGGIIHEYDTSTSVARPVHTNSIYVEDSILDFCLYPYSTSTAPSTTSKSNKIISELFPNRILAITDDRNIVTVPRKTLAPVAISPRDGRIAHAFGKTLWIGSPSSGAAAMESLRIHSDEDISSTMMRRARCQHAAKYSMVVSSNIKVLAEDGLVSGPLSSLPTRAALLRLWSWIERVEALCSEASTEDLWDEGLVWQAQGLIDAGALRLIQEDQGKDDDVEKFSDQLACTTYVSRGRRLTLTSCGWAAKFNLVNVLSECEDLGEYERGAALAVWHGDIEAAVGALERGSEAVRRQLENKPRDEQTNARISPAYAETLELVALSVAGYHRSDAASPATNVWKRSCEKILHREVLSGALRTSDRVAYIRAMLNFLMNLGSITGYTDILHDPAISLCDRVGFACRFLPKEELLKFLEECVQSCQASGDVEGIIITGLDRQGLVILQSYVDKYADVQTSALVTSRVIFPAEYKEEKRICEEWLDSYRSLLNSWQMWQSRAMFDVDRADLLRQVKARQNAVGNIGGGKSAIMQSSFVGSTRNRGGGALASRKQAGPRPLDPDIQAFMPCQLEARCNYCNSPLGLKSQDAHASQWLSKMKPVLSCCPQCRKPLPRCAICLLSLGALNPYMELTKDQHRSRRGGTTGVASTGSDLASLANLPFHEWYSWCMRCKHGGHAHHILGWFAQQEVCPVSGCHCRCQFDGIQKLNRPALTQRGGIVGDDGNSSETVLVVDAKRDDGV